MLNTHFWVEDYCLMGCYSTTQHIPHDKLHSFHHENFKCQMCVERQKMAPQIKNVFFYFQFHWPSEVKNGCSNSFFFVGYCNSTYQMHSFMCLSRILVQLQLQFSVEWLKTGFCFLKFEWISLRVSI